MIKSLVTNGGINCQKLQTVNKREIQGTIDDSAVVRAVTSHQCGPRSINAICGLSLLLVLSLAPRGFSPGTPVFPSPQKPTFPNSNSSSDGRRKNTM